MFYAAGIVISLLVGALTGIAVTTFTSDSDIGWPLGLATYFFCVLITISSGRLADKLDDLKHKK